MVSKLLYDSPATKWSEALPIGNGKLGAMVYGEVNDEVLKMNEDSVWYGGPQNRECKEGSANLLKIRKLLREGKLPEAEQLMKLSLSTPHTMRHYEPLGNARIGFKYKKDTDPLHDYHRELNLNDGVVTVGYEKGGCRYKRTIFSSYPDDAIVMHIEAQISGSIQFSASLDRTLDPETLEGVSLGINFFLNEIYSPSTGVLVMTFDCSGGTGVATMKVMADKDATVQSMGSYVIVSSATWATIIWTASTTVRSKDPVDTALSKSQIVSTIGYKNLYDKHLEDYQSLFGRMSLSMGSENSAITVPQLLEECKQITTVNPQLAALYVQYGRYLLISSSRKDKEGFSLPANLQGIWCPSFNPPWGSKYTININIQMNYWPSHVCNISECEDPLFDLIERVAERGRHTAQVLYNCKGWVVHHNTDIWADTAPQGEHLPSTVWVLSGPWLLLHFYENFLFTGNIDVARRAYPLIKGSIEFFLDFLIPDQNGYLVTSPSLSPENTYILKDGTRGNLCEGPTIDVQILDALFAAFETFSNVLGKNGDIQTQAAIARSKLPPMKIGSYGQLLEWQQEYDEFEPGHRHVSHLWGLYPGNSISPLKTPDLAEASRISLETRAKNGGGHTGWSRAWLINLWARLNDPKIAESHVHRLLSHSTMENLLDVHPPFQIDGNFGGAAGILEMLIQSQLGQVLLLPTVPNGWEEGKLTGVVARGGFELEFSWSRGKVNYPIQIISRNGNKLILAFPSQKEPAMAYSTSGSFYTIEINTTKGGKYTIY